ncbi:MAG: glycosyltransferase family 4 protein [Ilumatobacteraceae bacterium]
MKLLFVIDSLGASGAEHSTAVVLPVLRRRGHEIHVATLYDAGFGDEDRVRDQGFTVTPLRRRSWTGRLAELRRTVRAFDADVVHTSLFTCDVLGRVACLGLRARVVSTLVSTPYCAERMADPAVARWKVRALQVLDALTARLGADRMQAVSEGAADENAAALRYPRERISVVERGRDRSSLGVRSAERRARVREALGIAPDAPVVLAVGRQEYAKGLDELVRAVNLLVATLPALVVLIAGREGNASASLRTALDDHPGARACTRVLGHRHDVPDLMCAADVLAIASRYEGTAGTAIEAMALGLPVVATDMPGPRGVLEHRRNCLLVPVADAPAMAGALALTLGDPGLAIQLADSGVADFETRFTVEVAVDRLEAFYRDVVARGRKVGR